MAPVGLSDELKCSATVLTITGWRATVPERWVRRLQSAALAIRIERLLPLLACEPKDGKSARLLPLPGLQMQRGQVQRGALISLGCGSAAPPPPTR